MLNISKLKSVQLTYLWIFLILGLYSAVPSRAQEIPRKILAFYKGSENRTSERNEISQLAQLPLNNLGLVVEYRNAEEELPEIDSLQPFRGIVTWFTSEQMIHAQDFRVWLNRVLEQTDLPIVIFGMFGANREYRRPIRQSDRLETGAIFRQFGMEASSNLWSDRKIKITYKDTVYFDYEATLEDTSLTTLFDVVSSDPQNQVLLSLSDGLRRSDAAVLHRRGAYIQDGIIFKQITKNGQNQWYLNPDLLFSRVFKLDQMPRLDINSIGGKRTAFIHIDGDGFSTISKIDRWHLCAQLLLNRFVKQYPLPFSVSVIAAEIDSNFIGSDETLATARELFKQPNVEPASHGFAHPFDWRTGKLELDSIPGYRFDETKEIIESTNFIGDYLLPPTKPIDLFFWSGSCNPTPEQLSLAEQANLLSINGLGGKINPDAPSVSNFAPPYTQVGNRYRINARISNEYEFTNLWNGPYDGYKNVLNSIKFGDNQFIVPIDLYFHFYSLEFNESAKALEDVFKYAVHQDWSFIYTSQYVRLVNDFLNARIFQTNKDRVTVKTDGSLKTVCFPDESRNPDLNTSKNLLGYTRSGNDLLVHLNSEKNHQISFAHGNASQPYLKSFNRPVDYICEDNGVFKLKVNGFGNFVSKVEKVQPNQPFEIDVFTALSEAEYNDERLPDARQASIKEYHKKIYTKSSEDGSLEIATFITNRTIITVSTTESARLYIAKLRYFVLGLVLVLFLGGQFRRRHRNEPIKGGEVLH